MIDADFVADIIRRHDNNRPRSQQVEIGPSQLGSPCSRQLVYELLQVPAAVPRQVNLAAWVGTAMHAGMEQALADDPDWLTETRVSIPIVDGVVLSGSSDAYHKPSHTVVDWKSVGPSALDKYRRSSPDKYLTQINLYGLGMVLAGHVVDTVALAYIPRNGTLADIVVDAQPLDLQRAEDAIRRYEHLLTAAALGTSVLPHVGTADDCRYCPWWSPGLQDPSVGCDGHQNLSLVAAETQPNQQKETA